MFPLAGMAVRALAPSVIGAGVNAGKNFFAGKTGETVGKYNENAANDMRQDQAQYNEDPNQQADRQADGTGRSQSQGQNTSQADTILGNQLKQSNARADLVNTMAATDQSIAFRRGEQLANNYNDTANKQAATSANLMSSIINGPSTQYRSNI